MIYFYNFWLLPAFYMSTPALGVPSFRFFIGVMSYLANINRFAGLRVQLNQSAFSFFCSSDPPCPPVSAKKSARIKKPPGGATDEQ